MELLKPVMWMTFFDITEKYGSYCILVGYLAFLN